MRWATYTSQTGDERVGVVEDQKIYALDTTATLLDLLGDGAEKLLEAGRSASRNPAEEVGWDDVQVRAPLQPPSMRDAMCFHEHIRNCRLQGDVPIDERHSRFPAFYFSNPAAVIGPYDSVPISPGCEMFDFELETAAVIGKPGSNIAPGSAREHIIGYTIYCDWSARDLQMDEMQVGLGPAKGKDSRTTLGPVLVTADELEPFRSGKGFALAMTADVNGEEVTRASWSTIDWSFDDVVAYTSRGTTLRTGDVLGSGTVGRGCLFEHSRIAPDTFRGWLQAGDELVLEVEQIGQLRQRVLPAEPVHPLSSGH